jgi:hypothetical protein
MNTLDQVCVASVRRRIHRFDDEGKRRRLCKFQEEFDVLQNGLNI